MQWRQRYNINMNARGWLLNVALIIISYIIHHMLIPLQLLIVCHYRRRQHNMLCTLRFLVSLQLHHRIWSSSYQQMILLHRYHNYYAMSILLLRCISYHRKHHRLSVEPLSTTTTITLQYMSNFANHIIIVIMFVYAHTSSRQIMIWR